MTVLIFYDASMYHPALMLKICTLWDVPNLLKLDPVLTVKNIEPSQNHIR